jgi:hypothetical protein
VASLIASQERHLRHCRAFDKWMAEGVAKVFQKPAATPPFLALILKTQVCSKSVFQKLQFLERFGNYKHCKHMS